MTTTEGDVGLKIITKYVHLRMNSRTSEAMLADVERERGGRGCTLLYQPGIEGVK